MDKWLRQDVFPEFIGSAYIAHSKRYIHRNIPLTIMQVRTAEAIWKGNLKEGEGQVTVLGERVPYSFASRFEQGAGTNPEELLAAAHAGCVAMAFSNDLANAGYAPRHVHAAARVHLTITKAGPGISQIDLTIQGDVPGIDEATFLKMAEAAKSNCPVSKLFAGADIALVATLQAG